MTTDEMLDELAKIGRPRLHRCDDGSWSASIKFPAPDGVTAEVRSNFDHPTHRAALECVIDRIGGLRSMVGEMKARPGSQS